MVFVTNEMTNWLSDWFMDRRQTDLPTAWLDCLIDWFPQVSKLEKIHNERQEVSYRKTYSLRFTFRDQIRFFDKVFINFICNFRFFILFLYCIRPSRNLTRFWTRWNNNTTIWNRNSRVKSLSCSRKKRN